MGNGRTERSGRKTKIERGIQKRDWGRKELEEIGF